MPAVVEELRVARVLPGLVDEPAGGAAPVLDEAVAVEVAVAVDPLERAQRRLAQVADEPGVVGPAPDLGEEDEVERRRVDGAVVAGEPGLGALAVPNLVDDLAGLGVGVRVVLARLQLGEHRERVLRQLGAEEERLQARDQRVAAEDGHEPRHAGGRELAGDARCPRPSAARRGRRPTGGTSASGRPRRRGAAGTRSRQAASEARTRASSSPKRRSASCAAVRVPSVAGITSARSRQVSRGSSSIR